jgi:hypothetical protein
MGYIAKYATVVIKDGPAVTIKQFVDTTEARLYYQNALNAGKDAYYYFGPRKRKSSFNNPAPIEVTF